MLNGKNGQIYHLSPSDSGISIKNLVSMICNEMGKDFNSSTKAVAERIGQDKAYIIDSQKARRELGWNPKIQRDEGLRDVVQWVETNWNEISQPLEYKHKP